MDDVSGGPRAQGRISRGSEAPDPLKDAATAAPVLVLAFWALGAIGGGPVEPTRLRPFSVDAETAPWYHFAALEGVGETTARRWAGLRDLLASAGLRPSPAAWPRAGPRTLRRAGLDSRPADSNAEGDDG